MVLDKEAILAKGGESEDARENAPSAGDLNMRVKMRHFLCRSS